MAPPHHPQSNIIPLRHVSGAEGRPLPPVDPQPFDQPVDYVDHRPRYVRPLSPEACARALRDDEALAAIEKQLRGELRPPRHINTAPSIMDEIRSWAMRLSAAALRPFGLSRCASQAKPAAAIAIGAAAIGRGNDRLVSRPTGEAGASNLSTPIMDDPVLTHFIAAVVGSLVTCAAAFIIGRFFL